METSRRRGQDGGVRQLPVVVYRGTTYTVDFRLEELRLVRGTSIRFVPFRELKDGKLKSELRGLRARTWPLYYMKGLDD
ncbi:MAG: hypothetical protein AAB403_05220 [Planctomycetota bacterium]